MATATIAYNSCRNRHCPKCQGDAAKQWLAEHEAELLPAPYFHVALTLPAAIADIAYQNKAVIYDILFKTSAEMLITIAADPKHLSARVGIFSTAHLGLALTHHPHVHPCASSPSAEQSHRSAAHQSHPLRHSNPHSARLTPAPHLPRFPPLQVFRRRPLVPVGILRQRPASENLHMNRTSTRDHNESIWDDA